MKGKAIGGARRGKEGGKTLEKGKGIEGFRRGEAEWEAVRTKERKGQD